MWGQVSTGGTADSSSCADVEPSPARLPHKPSRHSNMPIQQKPASAHAQHCRPTHGMVTVAWAVGAGGAGGSLGALAAQPRQLAAARRLGWRGRGGLCSGGCDGCRSVRLARAVVADAAGIAACGVPGLGSDNLNFAESQRGPAVGAAPTAAAAPWRVGIVLNAKL